MTNKDRITKANHVLKMIKDMLEIKEKHEPASLSIKKEIQYLISQSEVK